MLNRGLAGHASRGVAMDFGEFKGILSARSDEALVREHVLGGQPHVFTDWPEGFDLMRSHLRARLGTSEDSIVVVGSAKLGFSLNPDRFGQRFSDQSDVDVVVVDARLFDELWHSLLRWDYPRRRTQLGMQSREWASDRRREFFSGWCEPAALRFEGLVFPEVLKPVRDLSTKWFNAFKSLSQHPQMASREFLGRLYRTWEHAVLYYADGVRQLRQALSVAAPQPSQ